MKLIAMVLIIAGIIGLAYGGVRWTQRDTVVDLGPVEITQDETRSIPLPPLVGAVCLIVGVVLIASRRHA
jgi:uncharacterized membrane protein YidH (DUF202 family)